MQAHSDSGASRPVPQAPSSTCARIADSSGRRRLHLLTGEFTATAVLASLPSGLPVTRAPTLF
eukprot:2299992-Pyramimonas_sp.AAC.1